jgi:hypothetical protein
VKFCHLGTATTAKCHLSNLALAKRDQRDLGGNKERPEEDEEDD